MLLKVDEMLDTHCPLSAQFLWVSICSSIMGVHMLIVEACGCGGVDTYNNAWNDMERRDVAGTSTFFPF